MCVENDAPMKEALCDMPGERKAEIPMQGVTYASSTTPTLNVGVVPNFPMHAVTRGDTRRAGMMMSWSSKASNLR